MRWKLVPVEPTSQMESAALCSRSRCDEGEHLPLLDYIDSAENHAHIVVRAALSAAVSAAPDPADDADLEERVARAWMRARHPDLSSEDEDEGWMAFADEFRAVLKVLTQIEGGP